MEKQQPSREEWVELAGLLDGPMGNVNLVCDGHEVDIQMQRTSKRSVTYKPAVYVDGYIKFKGDNGEDHTKGEGIAGKFWYRKNLYVTPAKLRAEFRRSSKRQQKWLREIFGADYPDAVRHYWMPTWPSASAILNHLRRTCDRIELTDKTRERLALRREIEAARHAD